MPELRIFFVISGNGRAHNENWVHAFPNRISAKGIQAIPVDN